MRYEFDMMNFSMWDWSRDALHGASYAINVQDTSELRSQLWNVWRINEMPDNDTQKTLLLIQDGITSLDNILEWQSFS